MNTTSRLSNNLVKSTPKLSRNQKKNKNVLKALTTVLGLVQESISKAIIIMSIRLKFGKSTLYCIVKTAAQFDKLHISSKHKNNYILEMLFQLEVWITAICGSFLELFSTPSILQFAWAPTNQYRPHLTLAYSFSTTSLSYPASHHLISCCQSYLEKYQTSIVYKYSKCSFPSAAHLTFSTSSENEHRQTKQKKKLNYFALVMRNINKVSIFNLNLCLRQTTTNQPTNKQK